MVEGGGGDGDPPEVAEVTQSQVEEIDVRY